MFRGNKNRITRTVRGGDPYSGSLEVRLTFWCQNWSWQYITFLELPLLPSIGKGWIIKSLAIYRRESCIARMQSRGREVKQATENREWHRQHICYIICLSLVPELAASFKCITCRIQVPQSFSQVGNATLWVVNSIRSVVPYQHGIRWTFQAYGLLGSAKSIMTKSRVTIQQLC
jgi:hypothetical protein